MCDSETGNAVTHNWGLSVNKWRDVKWSDMKWSDVKWSELKWSDVMWSEVMWCEVKWSDVRWSEVMWSEVKWCEVKWCEVKWSEVMWSEVKWCEVKWNEVMILGEMYVLSLIHVYVSVCMFCAVRCVIFIGFYLLFYSNSTYVFFNIRFYVFLV